MIQTCFRSTGWWRRTLFLPVLPLFFLAVVLPACMTVPAGSDQAQAQATGLVIDGMMIRNELLYPVTDVMINVPATGAFAGCGNIMQQSECRTRFEAVGYAGNPLVVSWKEYGTPHETDEFVVEATQDLDPAKSAWLEVVIFARGQAGARLIQF